MEVEKKMKHFLLHIVSRFLSLRLYSLLIVSLGSDLYFSEPLSEPLFTTTNRSAQENLSAAVSTYAEEIDFIPETVAEEATFMYVADIDQDGDPDIVTTYDEAGGSIAWYQNNGEGDFEKKSLAQVAANARIVHVADINGDQYPDILTGLDALVCYYGDAEQEFTSYDILLEGSYNIYDIHTADMDDDHDQDILIASQTENQLVWLRNNGQGNFSQQTLTISNPHGIISITTPDINGDNLPDIVGAYREVDNPGTNSASSNRDDKGGGKGKGDDKGKDDDKDKGNDKDKDDKKGEDKGKGKDKEKDEDKDKGKGKDKDKDKDNDQDKDNDDDDEKEDDDNNDDGGDNEDDNSNNDQEEQEDSSEGNSDDREEDEENSGEDNNNDEDHNEQEEEENVGGNDNDEDAEEENDSDENDEENNDDGNNEVEEDNTEGQQNNESIKKIVYFLNQGNGSFSSEVVMTEALSHPESVFAADLDGDGNTDILSASTDDNRVAWFRNLSATGTEALFSDINTISTNLSGVKDALAADIDGDGDLDVVAGTFKGDNKRVVWFENDGKGNFSNQENSIAQEHVRWLSASDVDGDGDQDMLATNAYQPRKIFLYRNQSPVQAPPAIDSFSPKITETDSIVTVEGANFGANISPMKITVGDASAEVTEVNATGTQLKFKVPDLYPGSYTIQLTVKGKTANAEEQLSIRPRMIALSPRSGIAGSALTIEGKNFRSETSDIQVQIGNQVIEEGLTINTEGTEIILQIPEDLAPNSYPVKVIANAQASNILNFTVTEDEPADMTDSTPPAFTSNNFAKADLQEEIFSLLVNIQEDSSSISKVTVNYSGITEDISKNTQVFEPDTHVYELLLDIPTAKADALGMKYQIIATNTLQLSDTLQHFTYRDYQFKDSVLYNVQKDNPEQKDYRIIAIPFESKAVADTWMGDTIDTYDSKQWRLFRYHNGAYEEYQESFTSFSPGEGYMFIQKDFSFDVQGQAATLTNENEGYMEIPLQPGWNLIGNPYPFAIDWLTVSEANPDVNIPQPPKTFREGIYANANELEAYEGAFLKNEGEETTLKIPVAAKVSSTARYARVHKDPQGAATVHDGSWLVNLQVSSDDFGYRVSGFGMHPQAQPGEDQYDDYPVPRFMQYLDLTFTEPATQPVQLTKSVVPVSDAYTWHFEVHASLPKQNIHLSWDNSSLVDHTMQLMLLDVQNNQVINMHEQQVYEFVMDEGSRSFKIFYGSPEALAKSMVPDQVEVGLPYPNPSVYDVSVPVSLPKSKNQYGLKVDIFDQTGSRVRTLYQDQIAPGFHTIRWNRMNQNGVVVPAGIYFYSIQIAGHEQVYTGKIIFQ